MAKLNWEFDYEFYGIHPYYPEELKDIIEKYIERYEKQGFKYIPFNKVFLSPHLVETPSNRLLTHSDIEKSLENLEFGNKEQIEALNAAEYLKLATVYY